MEGKIIYILLVAWRQYSDNLSCRHLSYMVNGYIDKWPNRMKIIISTSTNIRYTIFMVSCDHNNSRSFKKRVNISMLRTFPVDMFSLMDEWMDGWMDAVAHSIMQSIVDGIGLTLYQHKKIRQQIYKLIWEMRIIRSQLHPFKSCERLAATGLIVLYDAQTCKHIHKCLSTIVNMALLNEWK